MALSQAEKRRLWAPACVRKHRAHLYDAYRALDDCMRWWTYAPKQGQTWAANCRPVTGGSSYSIHSYFDDASFTTWSGVKIQLAIACDYNSLANPYGATLHTDMPREMVAAILAIRTNSGAQVWQWGGYFSGNKDAMHYEIACSPADLATGINWKTVKGHDASAPPPPDQGDEDDMKQRFYRIRDEANPTQPRPGDHGIWTSTDGVTTRLISEPAWVHFKNLGWWDNALVELIPETAHRWLVDNSLGGNTGVVTPIDKLLEIVQAHVEDPETGGGVGQIDYEKLADAIVDEEVRRLSNDVDV